MTPRLRPATFLIGAALLAPGPVLAQGPPALGVPEAAPADADAPARALSGWARNLEATVAANAGADPTRRQLAADAGEMALAVDEYRATRADPARSARALAGVDATWQQIRRGLAAPGVATPDSARAVAEVDGLMAQLRAASGLNPPPPGFIGDGPPPTGVEDVRRLAHALVSRSEGLLGAVQARMAGDPNQPAMAADAAQLVRLADGFHDAIDSGQPLAVAAQAFAPVDQLADRVGRFATTAPVPPEVRRAWDAVAAVQALIRQGLAGGVPAVAPPTGPPPGVDPRATLGLVDQMIGQIQTYEATFRSTARNVPEGFAALADAQRLLAAAATFRQAAAQGLPPNQLAFAFRDVDAHWQRLARRAARIARGRNGPYIQQVAAIGATAEQLHTVLGMTGYPPVADYGPGPIR